MAEVLVTGARVGGYWLAEWPDGLLQGGPQAWLLSVGYNGFYAGALGTLNTFRNDAIIVGAGEIVAAGVGAALGAVVARGIGAAVRYGPMNAGPLPAAIASTFRGGSYTATTLSEATTLYRVYGGTAGRLGSYWSRTAPSGPLQSTIDLALNPQWGNTASQVIRIQVPAGTTIFEGAAAAQGGLVGGGSQVFIPTVNPAWIIP